MENIVVSEKYGRPSIDGIICTYATKKIRGIIETMFESNRPFFLPDKYTYKILPSAFHGEVAKIMKVKKPFLIRK